MKLLTQLTLLAPTDPKHNLESSDPYNPSDNPDMSDLSIHLSVINDCNQVFKISDKKIHI